MRVEAKSVCSGHGRCYDRAPELFEPDEEGFVSIRGTTVSVPAGQENAAREAAAWCPEKALVVLDDQSV